MKSRAHDEAMAEVYRKDPDFARQVINNILEDENCDQGELLIVLRQMTKALAIPYIFAWYSRHIVRIERQHR